LGTKSGAIFDAKPGSQKSVGFQDSGGFSLKKYLFFRNSDIFRGFSFNKALISQKFRPFSGILFQKSTYFSKIRAKLGDFPIIKFLFFKVLGKTRTFFFEKVVIFRN
jgi:hypothetical protein